MKGVGGKGLRDEADSGTAESQRLLQMRQQMADQQVVFGGNGQADGKNLNGMQPELTGCFGQCGVGFFGISQVIVKG